VATYQALGAVCDGVVRLLQQTWRPELFDDAPLTFEVYRTKNFSSPMEEGVSLYPFRVSVNGTQRTPPSTPLHVRPLPLELTFLLTAWAKTAAREQEIIAWAMRTLEDHPLMASGLLNTDHAGVFQADEIVELVVAQLPGEELFRLWEALPGDYQLSVAYLARVVRIDSPLPPPGGGPVLERHLEYGVLQESAP
jgi:hypothetical protein